MPDATTHGFPFPEPTDPITDYPALAEDLAEFLDARSGVIVDAAAFAVIAAGALVDGQEVVLVDSLAAPTWAWRLKYRAAIADAYKWVVVSKSNPMLAYTAATTGATTSTSYIDGTSPPTLTVPRAGIYDVLHWCTMAGVNYGRQTVKRGAAAAADADATGVLGVSSTTLQSWVFKRLLAQTFAAADVLKLQVKTNDGAVSIQALERSLELHPLRIS